MDPMRHSCRIQRLEHTMNANLKDTMDIGNMANIQKRILCGINTSKVCRKADELLEYQIIYLHVDDGEGETMMNMEEETYMDNLEQSTSRS